MNDIIIVKEKEYEVVKSELSLIPSGDITMTFLEIDFIDEDGKESGIEIRLPNFGDDFLDFLDGKEFGDVSIVPFGNLGDWWAAYLFEKGLISFDVTSENEVFVDVKFEGVFEVIYNGKVNLKEN